MGHYRGLIKGVSTILVLGIGILLVNQAQVNAGDPTKCLEQCGGDKKYEREVFDGNQICHYYQDQNDNPIVTPKCNLECEGKKPAPDQNKCFCQLCKFLPEHFCKEPGVKTGIKLGECDTTVCKGEGGVKHRGDYCNAEDREEFEEMKKEIKD